MCYNLNMTEEDAARAYMWIQRWLNHEETEWAGTDLAPLLTELQDRFKIETYWRLMEIEDV